MSKRIKNVGGINDILELERENDALLKQVGKLEQENADLKIENAHLKTQIREQTIIYPFAASAKTDSPIYKDFKNA